MNLPILICFDLVQNYNKKYHKVKFSKIEIPIHEKTAKFRKTGYCL